MQRALTGTVSSLFANTEALAREMGLSQARLGARWSFGYSSDGQEKLTEYSLPASPKPLTELLEQRTGLRIMVHDPAEVNSLFDWLATGQPAIVAVDSYHLPYRPAYGRVHSGRTIVVRPHDGGRITVDDIWPPAWTGLIRKRDLQAARYSREKSPPELEPVYVAGLTQGWWYSLERPVRPFPADAEAMRSLLACLVNEAGEHVCNATSEFGLAALQSLRRHVREVANAAGVEARDEFRRVALLIRAELSSRVYFVPLLLTAARVLGDALLHRAALEYGEKLWSLEAARNVATKCVTGAYEEYVEYLLGRLTCAEDAEWELFDVLSAYRAGEHH